VCDGTQSLIYHPWLAASRNPCIALAHPHLQLAHQVSEQMDSLRVLFTDPVDYLVTPRVLACMVAGPILNVLCFCMGEQWDRGVLGREGS
jgi:hypothetical protein